VDDLADAARLFLPGALWQLGDHRGRSRIRCSSSLLGTAWILRSGSLPALVGRSRGLTRARSLGHEASPDGTPKNNSTSASLARASPPPPPSGPLEGPHSPGRRLCARPPRPMPSRVAPTGHPFAAELGFLAMRSRALMLSDQVATGMDGEPRWIVSVLRRKPPSLQEPHRLPLAARWLQQRFAALCLTAPVPAPRNRSPATALERAAFVPCLLTVAAAARGAAPWPCSCQVACCEIHTASAQRCAVAAPGPPASPGPSGALSSGQRDPRRSRGRRLGWPPTSPDPIADHLPSLSSRVLPEPPANGWRSPSASAKVRYLAVEALWGDDNRTW